MEKFLCNRISVYKAELECFDVRHLFFAFFSLDRWFVQIGLLTDCNKLLVVQRRWGKIPQSTKQKATKGQMWWSIWFYEHSKHLLPQNCLDGLRRLSQRTVYSFPWFHFKVHWIYLESRVDKKQHHTCTNSRMLLNNSSNQKILK